MQPYQEMYVDALCQEQKWITENSNEPINIGSIFFGGGTPSLLTATQISKIMTTVADCFTLDPNLEVTLEANPGTVSQEYLEEIHSYGINRISFGMQTAKPNELRILNRLHGPEDIIQAVLWSKRGRFERINLDLIMGIPAQTNLSWKETLNFALMENIDHLSLYALGLEQGTPLEKWVKRGMVSIPDEDLTAGMYEEAMNFLSIANYSQYEISNWSKQGGLDQRCRHNLQYWRYLPYLGFGAGAHGFYKGIRTENVTGVLEYIQRIRDSLPSVFPASPACKERIQLSLWEQMQEYLMVGFRLTEEGISKNCFYSRFGHHVESFFSRQLDQLYKQDLIENLPGNEDRVRLTRWGRLLGNQVFMQFVGNPMPEKLNSC